MPGPILSMSRVSAIHRCAVERTLLSLRLDHKQLRMFHLAMRRFYKSLGDYARDEYWAPLNAWGWGYLRRCLSAPLPLNHPSLFDPEQIDLVRRSIKRAVQLFPSYEQSALELLALAAGVSRTDASPMVDVLLQLHRREPKETVVVLNTSKLLPAVRDFFASLPELSGHTVLYAKSAACREAQYERMVLAGGAREVPHFLITAPRAMEVDLLRYWWLSEEVELAPALVAPVDWQPPAAVVKAQVPVEVPDSPPTADDQEVAAELAPQLTPQELVNRVSGSASESVVDEAKAMIFLLEGSLAVALDKAASALSLDLDGPGRPTAEYKRVPDVEPGMFLLLRTGGGNYILSVADQILRDNAAELRRDQRAWKQLLRQQVEAKGLSDVVRMLRGFGSEKATTHNLRTWCSEENICTQEFCDFLAIMSLLGRKEDARRVWRQMDLIRQAHHQAGQYVRRRLEEQVKRADLTRRAAEGTLEFKVPEYGVSITAYSVERVLPEPVTIRRSRLGRLVDMEGLTWPG